MNLLPSPELVRPGLTSTFAVLAHLLQRPSFARVDLQSVDQEHSDLLSEPEVLDRDLQILQRFIGVKLAL
jgi:hypothetical protein